MSRDHPDHDQIFKELLHGFLPEFLLLVAPEAAQKLKLEHGTFLRQEAFLNFPDGDRRHLDVVYRTETIEAVPCSVLVHVEVEAEFRSAFDHRMARYAMALHLRSEALLFPIALFLRGGGEGSHQGRQRREVRIEGVDGWVHRFRYLAFSLSGAAAEEYLDRKDPLAAALAALMPFRSGSPAEHKWRCMQEISRGKDLTPFRSFQLANIVETYIQLDPDEKEKYLHKMSTDTIPEVRTMQMSWADEMFAEWQRKGWEKGIREGKQAGLTLGEEKGRMQGRKEGRKEGELQAVRRTLIRLLTLRFGPLPSMVQEGVAACDDLAQLQSWTDGVLTASNLDSLGLHPPE
jgi:hypothetical protein